MSIFNLFDIIKNAEKTNKYMAIEIPGVNEGYLGLDEFNRPCIFLKNFDGSRRPSLCTERLSLSINQEYLLSFQEGLKKKDCFNSLICLSNNKEDIDTFLMVVEAFLTNNNNLNKSNSLVSFFHALVRLFLIKPDDNIIARRQGLWGELFLMRYIRGYAFWSQFWQTETNRLYDFSTNGKRIEVKTTTRLDRIHTVSHKQVFSYSGEDIFIASLMLREDDVGISLKNLITECREIFKDTPYYFKIEKAVRHANMQSTDEEGPIFNNTEAARNLKWYDSRNVPRFQSEEPEGVSGTHYKIDLTNSIAIDDMQLEQWINDWSSIKR